MGVQEDQDSLGPRRQRCQQPHWDSVLCVWKWRGWGLGEVEDADGRVDSWYAAHYRRAESEGGEGLAKGASQGILHRHSNRLGNADGWRRRDDGGRQIHWGDWNVGEEVFSYGTCLPSSKVLSTLSSIYDGHEVVRFQGGAAPPEHLPALLSDSGRQRVGGRLSGRWIGGNCRPGQKDWVAAGPTDGQYWALQYDSWWVLQVLGEIGSQVQHGQSSKEGRKIRKRAARKSEIREKRGQAQKQRPGQKAQGQKSPWTHGPVQTLRKKPRRAGRGLLGAQRKWASQAGEACPLREGDSAPIFCWANEGCHEGSYEKR